MFDQIKAVSDMIINPPLYVCGILTQRLDKQSILGQQRQPQQSRCVIGGDGAVCVGENEGWQH